MRAVHKDVQEMATRAEEASAEVEPRGAVGPGPMFHQSSVDTKIDMHFPILLKFRRNIFFPAFYLDLFSKKNHKKSS